ncbi:hypothetical protein WJX72_011074 [[Myrmecia] bisecta]|uniref:Nucleotide-diphospho-sugar transferase domain-containing protein n=1 Tax=[Myrmecia] bisecta TaxID=41462 RepID=A0AAW1QGK0_9CHLO
MLLLDGQAWSFEQDRAGPKQSHTQAAGPEQHADPARDLLASVAVDNTVIVTLADSPQEDFLQNWLHHIQALGLTNVVVSSSEPAFVKELRRSGVSCVFMPSDAELTADQPGGEASSDAHARVVRVLKARLISRVLGHGFHVVYSDVDAVWLRNPLASFARHPHLDLLISTDALTNHIGQDAEATLDPFMHTLNTGFILIRSNPKSRALAERWVKRLAADREQHPASRVFTAMLLRGANQMFADGSYTHMGWNGQLRFGVLPAEAFPSSRLFAGKSHLAIWAVQPYMIHMDPELDLDTKRMMLREFGAWATDPPEYYNFPAGFVSYNADIPEDLLRDTLEASSPDMASRWRANTLLLEHQRQQLRTGFVLAQALGRALVLPRILTGFRAFSNVHPSWVTAPLPLPLQGLLNMTAVELDWPLHLEMGPHLEVRDYGFVQRMLGRPGHAQEVFDSVKVELCGLGERGCADAERPARSGSTTVRLQAGLNELEISEALEALQSVRLLEFQSIVPSAAAFGGLYKLEDTF